MSNQKLRSKLIRLAHAKPELRENILPLLAKSKQAAMLTNSVRVHDFSQFSSFMNPWAQTAIVAAAHTIGVTREPETGYISPVGDRDDFAVSIIPNNPKNEGMHFITYSIRPQGLVFGYVVSLNSGEVLEIEQFQISWAEIARKNLEAIDISKLIVTKFKGLV